MEQLYARNQLALGQEVLESFPAVVIQGARQVGKSTFAKMLVEGKKAVLLSLDDQTTRAVAQLDPQAFVNQAEDQVLVIDEIQRDPELLLAIKSAIDTNRRPGRFILTGSSDLLRLSKTPDSLAGRAVTLELKGLSQGELLGQREDFAALAVAGEFVATRNGDPWQRQDYVAAIAKGGYPELHFLTKKMQTIWIDSYIKRLVVRDIGDVSRGLSSDVLLKVLRLIAASQSSELVQTRFAEALSISRSSIAAYLSALNVLYLTEDLAPWRANLTKREVGRHKLSVADSALALRLARVSAETLESVGSAALLGPFLEGFVAGELIKQKGWSAEEFELYHFRDRDGAEVDLVIEFANGKIFLIEVKATETYRPEFAKTIHKLATKLGNNFVGAAVLTLDPTPRILGHKIWGLPVSALWQN